MPSILVDYSDIASQYFKKLFNYFALIVYFVIVNLNNAK